MPGRRYGRRDALWIARQITEEMRYPDPPYDRPFGGAATLETGCQEAF